MMDTLHELDRHVSAQRGRPARIVVWAHNSQNESETYPTECDGLCSAGRKKPRHKVRAEKP
jgi:hypothetical protein